MADAGHYNFESSRIAHTEITHLFDFVSPAAIALWHLRRRVVEEIRINPEISSGELSHIFADGSGFHGGEIKRACIDISWDKQLGVFSQIILSNAIAVYEGFAAGLVSKLGLGEDASRELASALQFPPVRGDGDVVSAIQRLNVRRSAALKNVFVASSTANENYSLPKMRNLLICYRYFKELRNCIAHAGGVASPAAEIAYKKFYKVATLGALGLNEVPMHHPVVRGKLVQLELRGVIGLCDVILKIVTTVDAELSESVLVEEELRQRIAPVKKGKMLPGDVRKRNKSIKNLVFHSGFPKPEITDALEKFLKQNGKIGAF